MISKLTATVSSMRTTFVSTISVPQRIQYKVISTDLLTEIDKCAFVGSKSFSRAIHYHDKKENNKNSKTFLNFKEKI